MTATDQEVFFSAIPDLKLLVQALNEGKSATEVRAAWPTSSIYRLLLDGKTPPQLIIPGGESPALLSNTAVQ